VITVASTALAICALSLRIICIRPWWYFITAHRPVAECAAAGPTGPAPATCTVEPDMTPAVHARW